VNDTSLIFFFEECAVKQNI